MNIEVVSSLINEFVLTLSLIAPTIFVFGVTLLGTAIEKAQQEEKTTRETDADKIRERIEAVEKKLPAAKKDGGISKLDEELGQLRKEEDHTEKKINEIKNKYNSINLANTVLYPWFAFASVSLLGVIALWIYEFNSISAYIIILSEVILVFYGAAKIYKSLCLIQEISSGKKESETFDRMKDAFKSALFEHDEGTKEEITLSFVDTEFPLKTKPSTSITIRFRSQLTKGRVLHNAKVWFFVSDGIELTDPPETKSWKQGSDYTTPNIRTVEIKLGTLSRGPYTSAKLIIKSPENIGEYFIKYKIYADGYASEKSEKLKIIVK